MRHLRSVVTTALCTSLLGLFALPGVANAATVSVTVTDGTAAVAGAFVAVVNSASGAAVDAVISGADGKATLDVADVALGSLKVIVSKQGFDTATASTVSADNTVTVKASSNSALKFSNVFGAQSKSVVADAESGVFYLTADGQPSVWRTTDYAGTWAAVPTTADSATGLPQSQAQKVVTSGFPGEVAVMLRNGLWYSRDYGSTWASLDTQLAFNNLWWVHAGTSSYLFAQTGNVMKLAVMSATTPALSDWSMPTGVAATDVWAFAAGSQSSNQVFAAAAPRDGATSVKVFKLARGATSASNVTVSGSPISTTGMTFANTSTQDLLMISTLGGAELAAVVAYDKEGQGSNIGGSTGTLRAAYTADGGSTFTYSSGLMAAGNGGQSRTDFNGWTNYSTIGGAAGQMNTCNENETAPVGSLAPVSPAGSGLSSFKVTGTIRSCFFAFNTSGATANYADQATAATAAGKIALLPMDGANNNTGFAFDGGYDFATNFVAITGDGQFGLRKTAAFGGTAYRPTFGQPGQGLADDFINNQAKPGKGSDSGGIAVNGIVAPIVQDIAMAPNSTDGQTFLVSTGSSGGSRTILTTDGGKSFSTVNSAGAQTLDWWNGAGGKQWIFGNAPLDQKRTLRIKQFTTTNGTGATQMGEELAATAAQRDSTTDTSLRFITNSTPLAPLNTCLGLDQFIFTAGGGCQGGQVDNSQGVIQMTGAAGVVGTDKLLIGVSRGNVGDTTTTTWGTVGLLSLSANPGDDGATVSEARYFGSNVATGGTTTDATGQFGANVTGTYGGSVTAIAYCPTGSAPQVADKAFIAVTGKGVYVMSNVSGTPSHNNTPVSTESFKDLKADCDTGLLVGAAKSGPMLSFDGATFIAVKAPGIPSEANTVDVQASKSGGDVSVLLGSGSNVVMVNTSFAELGTTGDKVSAGTEKTPAVSPALASSGVAFLNDASKGRDVGQIADVELAPESGDKVTAAGVSATGGVHSAGVSAFATDRKAQIASSSGAFSSSASLAQQTLTTLLPGATTGGSTTAKSKVSTVKKGKTILVASAVKKAGGTIPAKSKVVVSQTAASKKICRVINNKTIQGLKKGTCSITVKVTPPKTVKVKKPKTVTTKVQVSVT